MTDRLEALERRLGLLESRNRMLGVGLATALVILAAGGLVGWTQAQTRRSDEPLRGRGLIIEDANGQPRIVLGSPVADRNVKSNPRTGIVINDSAGVERFAVTLLRNDRVVMGFDAPPGKGDDRNRERITIVADETGGSYIRFLDRRTFVPARLYLDETNRVWLEFNDLQSGQARRRRIGFTGEETVTERP